MTPLQHKQRNALERAYLADLRDRVLKVKCPRCGAMPDYSCMHLTGPRKGSVLAKYHGDRSREANQRGFVLGPHYWRCRRH